MENFERRTIDWEEGWGFIETVIIKVKKNILLERPVSSEEYMMVYTTVFNMCTQKPPHDYSEDLYKIYGESCKRYITSTVLPSLREKHGESMLRELGKRWENYKVMVIWLSRFFHYLDRYFIARMSLPSLKEVGCTCFHDLVYKELGGKVKDDVISLIDREREGEDIDRALLKNVLDIYVEIEMGSMYCYEEDFEVPMLEDTAAFYHRKASNWILYDSFPDYMLKAEKYLKQEKDRVSHYLHSSSEPKLLEKVQHELLSAYANQLLENEHSGCRTLLRDDKVEDLSRMFRLFSTIPRGLDLISGIFKQHVTALGTALVKQAEDSASNENLFLEAKLAGTAAGLIKLLSSSNTQSELTYCGLASLTNVLNALEVDPKRAWKGPWRCYDEKMLVDAEMLKKIEKRGITFKELVDVARTEEVEVQAFQACQSSVKLFREGLKKATSSTTSFVIASYSRATLGQTGDGHFSPLLAYHAPADMVLIMDVATFKYPPHWIPCNLLWEAMTAIDKTTREQRGFMIISKK